MKTKRLFYIGLIIAFLLFSCKSNSNEKREDNPNEIQLDFQEKDVEVDNRDNKDIQTKNGIDIKKIKEEREATEKILKEEERKKQTLENLKNPVINLSSEVEIEIKKAEKDLKDYQTKSLEEKVELSFVNSTREVDSSFVNSISEYYFQDGLVYTILVSTNMFTDFRLEKEEKITGDIALADSSSYLLKSSVSIEDGKEQTHIFIRALNALAWTSLIIPTNKRTYLLKLVPSNRLGMFAVRFNYQDSQDLKVAKQREKQREELTDLKNLDFSYHIEGSKEIKPICVFSSDKNTYIQFPVSFLSSSLAPSLYLNSSSGLSIINYSIRSNLYIVEFVLSKGEEFVLICDLLRAKITR